MKLFSCFSEKEPNKKPGSGFFAENPKEDVLRKEPPLSFFDCGTIEKRKRLLFRIIQDSAIFPA